MPRLAAALLVVVVLGASARAAEVVTMATLAVTAALDPLAEAFRAQTGDTVRISYDTGPNMARRVSGGEGGDVIIAPEAVFERLVAEGRVAAAPRASVGRVGVGLAVRRGAPIPDVSTADGLRQALLDAEAVYFSQGTSGAHVASVFERLGVAAAIRPKTTQVANGGVVMERIIEDRRRAVGFTMLSEIRYMVPKGATLAGPLPPALQNYTPYAIGVLTASRDAAAAGRFVAFLDSPAAQARFRNTGWEPLSPR
jgi:molybdate transport system substrate-binding protein